MLQVKTFALTFATGCALAGGVCGAAQASTSVTSAIKTQDRVIQASPVYKQIKHFHANTPAQAKVLIPKFAALKTKLDNAATVVSGSTTHGAAQKSGQTAWVTGVRELASGIGLIDTALKDEVAGRKGAAKTAVANAERDFRAANVLGAKADKLLGLKSGD